MRAAYTSATIPVLLENDLRFPFVAGISAGASNTINYVSQDPQRARESFVEFVEDPQFGSWRTWARGKGVFNAEYIYEGTGGPDQALPFDEETFGTNPAEVAVGGFHCASGETVYWHKEDMPTLAALARRVRASSTMPGLMPAVEVDGEDYVDGALGSNGGIALDAAKEAGYEKFFVVLTRPAGYRKTAPRLPKAYQALFRRYPHIARGLLERHENYNRVLDELASLEERGRAYVFRPQHMLISNQERRLPYLAASHALGLAQAREELPRWLEFLQP